MASKFLNISTDTTLGGNSPSDEIVSSQKAIKTALNAKANIADLAPVAISGSYNDLYNKPIIPGPQINSDWNATTGPAEILNKPTIPTVNNSTITIKQGGTTKGSFTLNQTTDNTIELDAGGGSCTAGDGIDITNDVISVSNLDCGTMA